MTNLTFSDLKQIVINGIGGKLDREDGVTEKLDGVESNGELD